MRALCGSIITAGALIGLGLASLGIGTRYQNYVERDAEGHLLRLRLGEMDTSLSLVIVVLVLSLLVGLATAFIGLMYHHHRRHHEWLRATAASPTTTHTHAPIT